jgi:hypothetical protein
MRRRVYKTTREGFGHPPGLQLRLRCEWARQAFSTSVSANCSSALAWIPRRSLPATALFWGPEVQHTRTPDLNRWSSRGSASRSAPRHQASPTSSERGPAWVYETRTAGPATKPGVNGDDLPACHLPSSRCPHVQVPAASAAPTCGTPPLPSRSSGIAMWSSTPWRWRSWALSGCGVSSGLPVAQHIHGVDPVSAACGDALPRAGFVLIPVCIFLFMQP